MRSIVCTVAVVAALGVGAGPVAVAQQPEARSELRIGNLVDVSSPMAHTGRLIAAGKADAIVYVNRTGGINGKRLIADTFDYGAQPARAVAQYRKWRQEGIAAIQGYREEDAEALAPLAAEDEVPYWSLALAAQLTDPRGKGPRGSRATPFHFTALPNYSDGARALLQWAIEDWKRKGRSGKPRFVYMGDNGPQANAARPAAEDFARELGFEILPGLQYSLSGDDAEPPCQSLKHSGATHAYLANAAQANVPLLRACRAGGVSTQFLAGIWGLHEAAMKLAGPAADGVVMVGGTAPWGSDVPGMKVLQEVARNSDPSGKEYRALPYARAACGVFYMADAMKWADQNGGVRPRLVREGMYRRKNWVPYGLDGVCGPASYSEGDHRGVAQVSLLQASVKGATEQSEVGELIRSGAMALKAMQTIEVPRKPEWLGW
jgi:branched-chain amino acid transport system substrate-binding protein